ncbi:MAG: type IX secretion system protein PorQ [Ignavibacteriaceae bacterium]|jgi:hypothetical protein|nr:MAG: helix-hairpin-helix DNA-binding class 1 [Chlorobi bacterium OLB4]MBW7855782.1 type IX secretion system protein PorQ [Ignavibacteria bacterium]MEB2328982.1 type IX secretion system protein PorQ [Ignavibacteriaceae bacterium]OQY76518.1 MAG: hypothetical protein B6D43_10085 [Ignavibacteriales bacterium UTCHB1]
MIRIKILSLVIVIWFCFYTDSYSQNNKIYNFLYLNPDARSSSMAGTFTSMFNDVNTIFYNPAGLATVEKRELSAGFFKYLLDINSGNIAYSQKYKDYGWFGAGIQYMNYGSFRKFDEQYNEIGTFGASELALSLGYASKLLPELNYGLNLKLIHSSIDEYSSSAIAVDLGLLYHDTTNTFSAGISIQNLGTQISKYSDSGEELPLNISIGASKQLKYLPLTVFVSINQINEEQEKSIERLKYFSIGGEFKLSDNVNLRVGYNNKFRQNYKTGTTTGLAGFSAGVGINFYEKYNLDYGFNSLGNVGSTHRINLKYTLD